MQSQADFNNLYKFAGGDREFLKDVISSFLKEAPGYWESIKTFSDQNDWEHLRFISHKIKSSFSFLGHANLEGVSRELEKLSKTGSDAETIHQLVEEMKPEFFLFMYDLNTEYKKLND